MFTGIVKAIGQISASEDRGGDLRLRIETGELDPSWGGNSGADLGEGTPGILELYVTKQGTAMVPYDSFIWSNGSIVRVYNRIFKSFALTDFA